MDITIQFTKKHVSKNMLCSKNAKAHNAKCLRRVEELATSKRNETGRFVTIEQLGIVEMKFNTRSNFVGGAGVVSRGGPGTSERISGII